MTNLTVSVVDSSPDDPSGEEIVDSLEPNTIKRGQTVAVTINGSGFDTNSTVRFVNGKGPAPSFSNINVIDENTIQAVVKVKKGGPRRTRVWDLQVGTGLLPNALNITP